MKRRPLSAEDQELWDRVRANTEPMQRSNLEVARFEVDASLPAAPSPRALRKSKSVILGKPVGPSRGPAHNLAPAIHDHIRQAPVQMDHKSFGKLKRGKLRPEGKIDLHGMTLDRHQVPQWRAMQPMKSVVLQIAQAHISHGGGGAYYVYLRRHR